MGWEARKRGQGSTYYTRSERDASGGVVRRYYGNGEAVSLFSEIHRFERARREVERADARNERVRCNEIDALVTDACRQVEAVMSAELEAAGYRRHQRGKWRKSRQAQE